jgi:N-acetylglutamate synthase-like GNAT family acetyltransferase
MTATITKIGDKNLKSFLGILPASLAERLKKNEPGLFALGTLSLGVACGTIVCFAERSILTILSLYIAKDYRRQGLESALLAALTERAKENNISRIEAHFSASCDYDLRPFYEEAGFVISDTDELLYEISLSQLKKLSIFTREAPEESKIRAFSDIDPSMLRSIEHKFEASGTDYVRFPLNRPDIERNMSAVIFGGDGNDIKSAIIFEGAAEGAITLSFAWAAPDAGSALLPLLRRAFRIACKAYGEKTLVSIPVVSEAASALVKKITGEAAAQALCCSAVLEFTDD